LNARDYYLDLQDAIHAAPHVVRSDVQFEEIDTNECYVRGVFTLIGGFELHIAEYVVTEPVVTRPKYRYHLQTSDGKLVSRGIARRITLMLLPFRIIATMTKMRFIQLLQ
jgi:hypothetical protein